MPIYFYTKNDPYYEFSNFSPYGIEMEGKWWPTVEHYFYACKFLDANYREKIRMAPMPEEAVLKKFLTREKQARILIDTGDEKIIGNSLFNYFRDSGRDGPGLKV